MEQWSNSCVLGESEEIVQVIRVMRRISKFDTTVLLTGASGVGKSMYANLIHDASGRSDGPFVSINCGAIPDSLLESELFGYEKGAFTGANQEGKAGLIELSNNGTLFLDEIGDLPLPMQVKLLKVIQEKTVMRIGGTRERKINFRLIAATNKNMKELLKRGSFREDLYYRLNVMAIHIPPLRSRREDIAPLLRHFLCRCNEKYGCEKTFSVEALGMLVQYDWPGNVRELENVVERAVLMAEGPEIGQRELAGITGGDPYEEEAFEGKRLKEVLEEVEKRVILDSFERLGSTIEVARTLGISQATASRKITKYVKDG